MEVKERIVQDKGLDHTLKLLEEGYLFIKNRMDLYKCNIFETHIICYFNIHYFYSFSNV